MKGMTVVGGASKILFFPKKVETNFVLTMPTLYFPGATICDSHRQAGSVDFSVGEIFTRYGIRWEKASGQSRLFIYRDL